LSDTFPILTGLEKGADFITIPFWFYNMPLEDPNNQKRLVENRTHQIVDCAYMSTQERRKYHEETHRSSNTC